MKPAGNGTPILNRLEGRDSKNGRRSALEPHRSTIRGPARSSCPFPGHSAHNGLSGQRLGCSDRSVGCEVEAFLRTAIEIAIKALS